MDADKARELMPSSGRYGKEALLKDIEGRIRKAAQEGASSIWLSRVHGYHGQKDGAFGEVFAALTQKGFHLVNDTFSGAPAMRIYWAYQPPIQYKSEHIPATLKQRFVTACFVMIGGLVFSTLTSFLVASVSTIFPISNVVTPATIFSGFMLVSSAITCAIAIAAFRDDSGTTKFTRIDPSL